MPEQGQILARIEQARSRNDRKAIETLRKELVPPADALVAAKCAVGAEWIREMGYICTRAEKKYGADWVEKSDEELFKIRVRLGAGD